MQDATWDTVRRDSTALVDEVCTQSLPLSRGTQSWGRLHLSPMAPFPVLDADSGGVGGPRHWVLHGGEAMAAITLGICASLPSTSSKVDPFRRDLRRLGQPQVKYSCHYSEPPWLGRVFLGQESSSDHGHLSLTRLCLRFSVQYSGVLAAPGLAAACCLSAACIPSREAGRSLSMSCKIE